MFFHFSVSKNRLFKNVGFSEVFRSFWSISVLTRDFIFFDNQTPLVSPRGGDLLIFRKSSLRLGEPTVQFTPSVEKNSQKFFFEIKFLTFDFSYKLADTES